MKSLLPIVIREKTDDDNNFIYSSWTKNLYSAPPYSFIPWSLFCKNQIDLINHLFSISTTLIACLEEDPSILLGYLTYSTFKNQIIIHYGNVKQAYRKNYIMDDLLSSIEPNWRKHLLVLTAFSKTYPYLREKFSLTYDPYIINLLGEMHEQ
jgi:hypothetical protein